MWEKNYVLDIKRVQIPLQIYPLEENFLCCLERQNTRYLEPCDMPPQKRIPTLNVSRLPTPKTLKITAIIN